MITFDIHYGYEVKMICKKEHIYLEIIFCYHKAF